MSKRHITALVALSLALTSCASGEPPSASLRSAPSMTPPSAAVDPPSGDAAPVADDCRRFTDFVAATVIHASGLSHSAAGDAGMTMPADVRAALDTWAGAITAATTAQGSTADRLFAASEPLPGAPPAIDRYAAQICGTG